MYLQVALQFKKSINPRKINFKIQIVQFEGFLKKNSFLVNKFNLHKLKKIIGAI